VLIVAGDLTIRRFTLRAQELLALIPGDVGRPLSNIATSLDIPDLQQAVSQVMASFRPVERTVTDRKGNRFQLRVLPYRAGENRVDGAVITLVDVSRQGEAHAAPSGASAASS